MPIISNRTGGIAGILGGIMLVVAGFLPGTPPAPDDSAAKFLEYVDDKQMLLRWQAVLFAVAIVLLFAFIASLSDLHARSGASTLHAAVPLAGLAALTGIAFAGAAPLGAVVFRGVGGFDAEVIQLLVDVYSVSSAFVGIAGVVIFASGAALAMKTTAVPRWTAYIGLAAALLNIPGVIAILFDADTAMAPGGILAGPVGLLAAVVWVEATAVTMLRGADSVR